MLLGENDEDKVWLPANFLGFHSGLSSLMFAFNFDGLAGGKDDFKVIWIKGESSCDGISTSPSSPLLVIGFKSSLSNRVFFRNLSNRSTPSISLKILIDSDAAVANNGGNAAENTRAAELIRWCDTTSFDPAQNPPPELKLVAREPTRISIDLGCGLNRRVKSLSNYDGSLSQVNTLD